MSKPLLFGGPAPRLFSAPASAPFLTTLARAMLDELRREDDPFALSDALVLLPNRRAVRGLMDAFRDLVGAALLPAIRPLGDLEEDPEVWGAEPIDLGVSAEIAPTRQRLELARLIRGKDQAAGGDGDPVRALALADELRRVLDAAASSEKVHWEKLPTLAGEVDLAKHWEASAEFLKIVADYWPERLRLEGLTDPSSRRQALLMALAKSWQENPPDRPIIIAGSTGSIYATRALMRVVMNLPRGCVLFPGLDIDLDDEAWDALGDQHPQFALKETLKVLDADRREVRVLGDQDAHGHARAALIREALAPAAQTADWLKRLEKLGGKAFVVSGGQGLSYLEAATEDEEASAIALLMRECIETPDRDAALVTPDVNLARRVEAKLARWGVSPVVSHGQLLRQSPTGMLLALLCDLAERPADPVALAALIKHPLLKLSVAEQTGAARELELHALRGAPRFDDLDHIIATLAAAPEKDKARAAKIRASEFAATISKALKPLQDWRAGDETTLAAFATALTQCAETLSASHELWAGLDGQAAAGLLEDIIAHGAELGPLAPRQAVRAFLKLLNAKETPPRPGGDSRLAIWGPLEARLQRRDLMILGGLNEGIWPSPPPDDPFLSRLMRAELGLPSPDARIGLAAHDFAQLAAAPEVVLTRALKRDGAPSVKSRWLWRLDALTKGAEAEINRADHAIAWARALDAPKNAPNPVKPNPMPPAQARLKSISVTQVETLIRDPYAVYARRILGLRVLDSVGAPITPAERGTAIHGAIEEFGEGEDAAHLLALLDQHLRAAGVSEERRAAERLRLAEAADQLVQWIAKRKSEGVIAKLEEFGELALQCGVKLICKADRIELEPDGGAYILDFKTGAPPSDKQVNSGLSPQLLLEAAMLARKAFPDVPAARAKHVVYWRMAGSDPGPRVVKLDEGAAAAGEQALIHLEKLLLAYARETQAFLSSPRVQFIAQYRDYDHLARRKEWADAEGGE